MKIVKDKITIQELIKMAQSKFGNLIKGVVDVERGIIAIDGDLHADEEALLIENGSKQTDLWGINIYPQQRREEWIEFDSMINLKPSQGNRSRGVDDQKVKEKITNIVNNLVE